MKKLVLALFVILAIYACSGGRSESSSNGGSLAREPVNTSIDLRLGQIASTASPVAISATLQNGESLTAFTTNDEIEQNFDVIYTNTLAQSLLVNLNLLGKPTTAQFQDTIINFSNYTKENTVDISIQFNDTSRTARTILFSNQPIDQKSLDFINGDTFLNILLGSEQDLDSGARALLAASVGALKLVGCSTNELGDSIKNIFPQELLQGICTSTLLDRTTSILEFSDYQSITLDLKNVNECINPVSFDERSNCALLIASEIAPQVPKTVANNSTGGSTTDGSATNTDTGGSSTSGSSVGGNSTGSGSNVGGASGGNGSNVGGDGGGSNIGGDNGNGSNGGSGGGDFRGIWTGTKPASNPRPQCDRLEAKFEITGNEPNCLTNCSVRAELKDVMSNIAYPFMARLNSSGQLSPIGFGIRIDGILQIDGRGDVDYEIQSLNPPCQIIRMKMTRN